MNYNEIVSVSKLSGLYQIHKQRTDGLIIKSLSDDKIVFASSRNHSFTPLENITIFTDNEPMELKAILIKMNESKSSLSIPDPKSSNEELKAFFGKLVPDYDKERVYVSDIQKIIKWYKLLENHNVVYSNENKETTKQDVLDEAKEDIEVEKKAANPKKKVAKKTEDSPLK